MILYFMDRRMSGIGLASIDLPDGMTIVDDLKTEEVDTGVATFECSIPFSKDTKGLVKAATKCGNYVLRHNDDEDEVYTIIDSEVDTKKGEAYIYAEDAGLDLLNEIAMPYAATEAHPIAWYINRFAIDTGFEIGVNEAADLSRTLSWDGESTITERLASVATQFGCELSYSFTVDGLQLTHKYINVYRERGEDSGIPLRLNYEVDKIITSSSIANLATALYPTGGTPEGSETAITLNGYYYDDGDIYLENGYLKSREAVKKWSRYLNPNEPYQNYTGHILKTYTYDTTDQSVLCTHAISELKKICDVAVNYEIDVPNLTKRVKIGDRVNVVDDDDNLYISARMLKLETSIANQKRTATLGEYLIKGSGINQKVIDLASAFAAKAQETAKAFAAAQAAQVAASTAQASANTAQSAANGAQSTANNAMTSATANAQDLANYITGNTAALADIQSQIDGSITTWFYAAAPANSNVPASEWTTITLKNTHLGDLYYDTTTGYCYRWQVVSQAYSWSRVSDVDVTKALADAAAAQDTADAKRRVFVNTPVPPYDVGDLWAQGSGGDVLKCIAAKTSAQSYVATDWGSASKYTDDTTANSVQSDLNNNYTDTSGMTDAINLKFGQITLTVEAGTGTNAGKLFVKVNGGGTDKQGTIDLTGLVKFTDLATAGSTVINGDNITTGTINANLINGGIISSSAFRSLNSTGTFGLFINSARLEWDTAEDEESMAHYAKIEYASAGLAIVADDQIQIDGTSVSINGFNFSKLGTHFAAWANYGRCVDTNYNFNYYANLVMTALSPTSVVLKMTGKVGTNYNSASYYQYGISIAALTNQIKTWMATLGRTVSSVTYNPKSQWLAWNYGTGALMTGYMQYGTCFEVDTGSGVLRPARVYTTSGDVGGWQISTWYTNAAYFEATIFANLA